jgi:polyphenol oxidase
MPDTTGVARQDTARSESIANLPVERFDIFDRQRVVHGITTRTRKLPLDGNMSFMVGDQPELVSQCREAWAQAIGYASDRLVLPRQVHETTVLQVDHRHASAGADSVETSLRRVDALITRTPELPIGVMAADCVPILLHDPVQSVIGAVHAGWRGTVDGIASIAISRMRSQFGTNPADLRVGLGPSICVDCYQVGDEVIDRWQASGNDPDHEAVESRDGDLYFNLRLANLIQLRDAGVEESNIERSATCTRCSNGAQFSRRGLGPRTGLFTSVIMLNDR